MADAVRLDNLVTRLLLDSELGEMSYERAGDTATVRCSSRRAYQLSNALREIARREDRSVEERAAASGVIASLAAAMRGAGMVEPGPII